MSSQFEQKETEFYNELQGFISKYVEIKVNLEKVRVREAIEKQISKWLIPNDEIEGKIDIKNLRILINHYLISYKDSLLQELGYDKNDSYHRVEASGQDKELKKPCPDNINGVKGK